MAVLHKYDQDTIQSGCVSKLSKDEAFLATECSNHTGRANDKSSVECHNCHKTGHYKHDCWAQGGGKEGHSLRSKRGSKGKLELESVRVAEDKVVERAWMAMMGNSLVEIPVECNIGLPLDPFSYLID